MRRRPGLVVAVLLPVLGGLTACGALPGADPDGDLVTLAKVPDWAGGYQGGARALEVAYDEQTAQRLWADQVPADLPQAASGAEPATVGVHADLADVDLTTHVVVVWSSGESSSCPAWVSGLSVTEEGVRAEERSPGGECTADFSPYRLVLAVPRDSLPAQDELPVPITGAKGAPDLGTVTVYGE